MYEPGDRCSWCYTIVPIIATAERPAEPPQVASVGGEPLRQQQAPTRATIVESVPSAPAPLRAGLDATSSGQSAPNGTDPTPLSLFDPPAARGTDPITSHQAAASISEQRRRAVHAQVLVKLLTGPATDFDLARHTGLIPTSVGCRRKELCREGLVTALDRTGLSDTGSPATRWELTVKGRMAAQAAAEAAA